MNWDAWVTLGVTGLVFGLLAGTQISPDVILCGGGDLAGHPAGADPG